MKRITPFTALLFTFILVQLLNCGFFEYKRNVREMTISHIPIRQVRDGVYRGECDLRLVKTAVEVTVRNRFITSIQLLQHENGRGKKAESVIKDVLGLQTTEVDVVTGATASSKAILKAIENALAKGRET